MLVSNTKRSKSFSIQCASSVKPKYTSGSHLLIEQVTSKVQYGQNKTQFDLPVVLNDIPTRSYKFHTTT